jgi:tetratricopeptide (TPR) repeat protein
LFHNKLMMKKTSILFLLLFTSVALFAQSKSVDSLLLVLKKTNSDIDKVTILNLLSDNYKFSDAKKMFFYGNEALVLAKKINLKVGEGNALLNIGNSKIIEGDYKLALDHFQKAQDLFEKEIPTLKTQKDIDLGLAKAYGSIGIVLSEQSNYSKSLRYYLKSVKIYEKLKDYLRCSKLYNNIGVIYKSEKSDLKALEFFSKAEKIQLSLKDENIAITQTNIANIFLKQNNLNKALSYYNLAKISLEKNPNPRALGEWYNNIGILLRKQKKNSEAIQSWKNAIEAFNQIDDKFGKSDTYFYLGELYYDLNNLNLALLNINTSLQLGTELNVLELVMKCQKILSDIYTKQGNISKAFNFLKKYTSSKDSLINEENIRKSVELSLNYEFDKKELIQKEENEKKQLLLKEEAKSFKLKVGFIGLILILIFGIIFLIYNRNQLKKTLTLQKELAEYEQKALHLQMNPHFVFNCLGSISSFIVQNGTDSAIKYLAKFSKLMRLTLEYSKESLIPIDKEIESLQNYLELEQLRFNDKFVFSITKNKEIEDDIVLPPLLLQPFVENAIIHGVITKKEKGEITITFSIQNGSLLCTIQDDGIGINQSKINKENSVLAHKSMAIDIIKKRLERIASSTAKPSFVKIEELNEDNMISGTKVVLQLPLQYINSI